MRRNRSSHPSAAFVLTHPSAAFVLAALIVAGSATPLLGAQLLVTVVGDGSRSAMLHLVAPDGTAVDASDDDGDGNIQVDAPGGGGEYRLRMTWGEVSAEKTLNVPRNGELALVFDPEDPHRKIQVVYAAGNEEITVTARKREESLQSTPISIAAYTAEAIEERSMRDLSDVADFTTNVDFTTTSVLGGSTNQATVYIRGIGQIAVNLWADPGVGIYLDGVYMARAQGAVMELVDVERVEVLRGPQGTLFGKNTIGGALSLITKKPDANFRGHVGATGGSFDRTDASFHVGGALAERLFATLSLATTHADGVTRSLWTREAYNDDNTSSGRGALRWQPSHRLTLDATVDSTRQRERAADTTLLAVTPTPILTFYNNVTGTVGFPLYDERWITGSLRESYSSDKNFADADISGTSVDIFRLLGTDGSVRSISAYRQLDASESNDLDGTPIVLATLPTDTFQKQWSEEVQVSGVTGGDRLTWLVGGIYFEEKAHQESRGQLLGGLYEALESAPGPIFAPPGFSHLDFLCNPGPPPPGFPCFGGAGNPLNLGFRDDPDQVTISKPHTTSYAVFGEATLAATDRLSVTVGLRFNSEDKEYLFRDLPGPTGISAPVEVSNQDRWETITPRVNLAFQARRNLLLYASAANGFKSGGFNGLFGDGSTFLEPFEPERVWTYELGFKGDSLSNRLRWNGAFFLNDYTDLQMTASSVDAAGNPVFVVQNAGKADIRGLELEIQAQASRAFRIDLGVGYLDSRYTELDASVTVISTEGKIPKTPEWNVVLSPEYTFHMKGGGSLLLRADYSYKSKVYNDIANSETVAQAPYSLINARASWILAAGDWELFAYGTNLTDKEYLEHGVFPAAFGPSVGVSGRPREWGAGVRYRF